MESGERRTSVRHKNLDHPDQVRQFPNGTGGTVEVGTVLIGRAVLQPGWRWSTDIQPAVGTASCLVHHLHVLLAGRIAFQPDGRAVQEFVPNDVIDVPPGHDAWVVGDEPAVLLDISGNSVDFALPASSARTVATMLMTDMVESTTTAARLGDQAWKQLLAEHDRLVRRQIERFRGREVNTTGDGFLAMFDSAGAAVLCAIAIRDVTRDEGFAIRAGVHTGEVELVAGDIRGIAVHATARIMSAADPSEVLVSAVTRLLAEGSGVRFEPHGHHTLKGLPAPLELFAAEREQA